MGLGRLHDNSFLTHLATGRLILDGGVPRADPYSFTAAGEPWVVQSWLASLVYAVAEEVGGLDGVRLVNGALCAGLGLAAWALTGRSRSLVVRGAVTALVLVTATDLWAGRPLLFGLLGTALVLLAADGRLDPRWMIPVAWVWVNTHGSFPYALLLLATVAVGARLDRGRWGREPRVLAWATVGVVLGAVNPLGPRLLLFPASLGARTEAFRSVVEWQAPRYQVWVQYAVLAALLGTVLALVRRPRWRDALPVVVFGGLALTSARNQATLVLVVAPVLAGALPGWGPDQDRLRRAVFRPALLVVPVLALALGAAALAGPSTALGMYPEDAVAWMDERDLWGAGSRVVAPDYVGNYRTARAGADARVFIDDRVDMYPLSVIEDYKVLLAAGPTWDDVLRGHAATAVLWPADSPLGGALDRSPAWSVVRRDERWLVAVPASPG